MRIEIAALSRPGSLSQTTAHSRPTPEAPASASTGDVLEISALGNLATSLGDKGVESIRRLLTGGRLPEGRLLGFVQNLSQSGFSPDSVSDALGSFSSYSEILNTPQLRNVFDQVESRGMSGDLKYLDALDQVFDLGYRDVGEIFSAGKDLSDEELGVYLKSLTDLLKAGVVGTETVKFRGEPTKVFIENEIGSDYARAPLYRERFPF